MTISKLLVLADHSDSARICEDLNSDELGLISNLDEDIEIPLYLEFAKDIYTDDHRYQWVSFDKHLPSGRKDGFLDGVRITVRKRVPKGMEPSWILRFVKSNIKEIKRRDSEEVFKAIVNNPRLRGKSELKDVTKDNVLSHLDKHLLTLDGIELESIRSNNYVGLRFHTVVTILGQDMNVKWVMNVRWK